MPLLTAPTTAYTTPTEEGDGGAGAGAGAAGRRAGGVGAAAEELTLVAAVVARNNARVLVTGSLQLLANAALSPPARALPSSQPHGRAPAWSNSALASGASSSGCSLALAPSASRPRSRLSLAAFAGLVRWLLHEEGELRLHGGGLHLTSADAAPLPSRSGSYAGGERVRATVRAQRWHSHSRRWVPLEATPHMRLELLLAGRRAAEVLTMEHQADGLYSASIVLPQRAGTYTLRVCMCSFALSALLSSRVPCVEEEMHCAARVCTVGAALCLAAECLRRYNACYATTPSSHASLSLTTLALTLTLCLCLCLCLNPAAPSQVSHVRPGETRLTATAPPLVIRPVPRGSWSLSTSSPAAAVCSVLAAAGTLGMLVATTSAQGPKRR
jgi:hypothetical protein